MRFNELSRMGRLINAFNWENTRLGAIENWPPELCNAVALILEARIPMYIAWGDDYIQFFNDAYLPILGEKGEKEIGRTTPETWSEIWNIIGPMFNSVVEKGESFGFPGFNLFLERGSFTEETFFDFSYSPIRKADGTVGGLFLSCLETTERVLHERRMEILANAMPVNYEREVPDNFLKESHRQLMLSPKDVPYSLFIEYDIEFDRFRCLSAFGLSNPDGTKSFLNPKIIAMLREGDVEGLFDNSTVFKDGLSYDLKVWDEDPRETYILTYSYNYVKTRNIVMIGVSPRAKCTELYKQFFSLCGKYLQNQYEHYQMRKQEEEQLKSIKELSVKKDEFISVASHELKTPLTSAKAFLQIAENKLKGNDALNLVGGALKQLDRLQKLTADLLDVSKINAGKLDYKMAVFNFSELIEEVVTNFQSTVSSHTLEIEKLVDAEIEGDRHRLEQVVNNLISNAVKYSPTANRVVIRSEIIDGQLVCAVEDFGVGIPEDRIHRLFERFYRIEETAMHFQGMGLGLFIVSEILSRHKGRFWLESELGKGSTFYFMLPIYQKNEIDEIILDNSTSYIDAHIAIHAQADQGLLTVNWKGFQDMHTVKNGCMKILEMLRKFRFSKVLNDNRMVIGTWSDASDWVGKEWFPAIGEAGLKQFAWIYSKSRFSKLAANKAADVKKGGVETRFFDTEQEALKWLAG